MGKETANEKMTQYFLRFTGSMAMLIGNKVGILFAIIFVCLRERELNESGVFPQTY